MDMAPTPKAAQWTISTSTRRAMRCVEDNAMNSRFTLGSALCFTTMTALHGTGKFTDSPLVTVAQSSALSLSLSLSLPPSLPLSRSELSHPFPTHTRRVRPLPGASRTCAEAACRVSSTSLSIQELRKRPASAKAPQRSFLLHHASADRASLSPSLSGRVEATQAGYRQHRQGTGNTGRVQATPSLSGDVCGDVIWA